MRKHRVPSDRALKAIALKAENPRISNKEAAIQAGYSVNTAVNAAKNIFDRPLVQTWLENYRYTIEKAGLTQYKVAMKLDELLDAKYQKRDKKGKVIEEHPNHNIQLQTIKVYNEIFGINVKENPDGLKRRMTIEEFDEKEIIQAE